jgi:hypothetical protein
MLQAGDHVKVRRYLAYAHHGIYIGAGRVIHFDGEPLARRRACIREGSLDEFLRGGRLVRVSSSSSLSPEEVVRRAQGAVHGGFGPYRLLSRNCEHFASWCKLGRKRSVQVRRLAALAVLGLAGLALRPWGERA